METTLKTAPAVEPLTVTEVARHVRVDVSDPDENTYLNGLITVAREQAEMITWRKLVTQTWYGYLQDWPSGDYIELPFGSLQTVTAIKYTDEDGDQSTWDSAEYIVGSDYQKGRVTLADGYVWPNDDLYPSNPIEIEFVCGYGLAADVPWKIKHAMKLMIGELYENRETAVVGTIYTKIDTINNLLSNYRLNEL
jgi:uncharacterized phiE125 gp8 family phage protein